MKTLFYSLVIILGLAVAGCAQQSADVTFEFTATGDDGNVGTASFYDIRYSTDTLVLVGWDSAFQVEGEPFPKISGSGELFTLTVDSLESGKTYYFAIRVGDDAGLWSGNSNTISILAPDWYAPSAVMNFNVRF